MPSISDDKQIAFHLFDTNYLLLSFYQNCLNSKNMIQIRVLQSNLNNRKLTDLHVNTSHIIVRKYSYFNNFFI